MISRLLRLLEGGEEPVPARSDDDLRLAVAALLVEAARMDDRFGEEERSMIAALLSRRYELPDAEASALVAQAHARVSDSVQYFRFTNKINQALSATEKTQVIEMLWRVAYADGTLDAHEDQLIRQVAGLIHVPDRERMLARQRALPSTSNGPAQQSSDR
jgi:uncharacterized tellurite resistance protein B-like protein